LSFTRGENNRVSLRGSGMGDLYNISCLLDRVKLDVIFDLRLVSLVQQSILWLLLVLYKWQRGWVRNSSLSFYR
jgi:hypothetical protein